MGRVFQPTYTKKTATGERVQVKVKNWYAEYTDAAGDQQRVKIGLSKRAAESALARLQEEADRKRAGLPDPVGDAKARNRPTAELFKEYVAELENRDTSAEYRAGVTRHLDAIATACKWYAWSNVSAAPLSRFLSRLRAGTGKKKGASPATANGYLRSAKGFANWYADHLDITSPLRSLKPFNEHVDRRRSRRVLSDPEFVKFLAGTEATPPRHNAHFTGSERAALYRVAAFTGFRASELASLYPESFALTSEPPTVTVEAKDTKGKRLEPIPLADDLIIFLKRWLPTRPAGQLLWPGRWAKDRRQVKWIARDAKRANLGTGITFHSMRRKFVTGLIKHGADVDEVRRLARHRSVKTTLDHYAESGMADLARAVNRLPPLG